MRRFATFALAVVAALVLAGGAAAAHANYVKSTPAADARLVRSPAEIRVTFSEPPDPRGSDIEVLDATGVRRNGRDVTAAADEANTLRVSVPELPEGGYLVSWTARSTVDGHDTKGAFAFAVGNAPLPSIPDVGGAAPPPAPLELAGRAISFAGIGITIGTAFFVLFIRRPGTALELRRERRLVLAGGGLLVAGSAILLVSYGPGIPGRLLQFVLLRGAAGLVAIAALRLPERLASADVRREVVALAGLVGALSATLVSHAAATGDPRFVVSDFVHVVAISIWSGGVVALLALAIPAIQDRAILGATVWRFSLVALACVGVIVATGTVQSLDRLVLLEDLFETPYGVALLAKIVMLLLLLALGALNLLVWGPRLRAGLTARARLALTVMTETSLFGAVLVATAFLTALAPPAQANAAAFDETQRVDGVRIELLLPTANPGRNRYVVRVSEGLAPVTNAERVALRFTMVEHDMGEQELVAAQRSPGEYVAEGSPTAMFGTWKVQTIVRLPGRLDLRALFTVPIANAGGQLAQVIAIPAAPATPVYTLVAFTDPAPPQAGAPFAVNVVLVDAKGDPVRGKELVASFSGPEAQAPITAAENAAELGPGRYRVDVPALAAGSWKVTLALGGEGSGVYTVDVAR